MIAAAAMFPGLQPRAVDMRRKKVRAHARIFEPDLTPPHLCSRRMQEHGSAAAARTKVCPRVR